MSMSLVVLSALWDAIIMASDLFVLQIWPFLKEQCLTLLRSLLTLCSAKSVFLEPERIVVSSAYNERVEVEHEFVGGSS